MSVTLEYPLLSSQAEQQRRRALLREPHMKPLDNYLADLRSQLPPTANIPKFDPCDGGIEARALFLLEAPQGKMESGFISHENHHPTATNFRGLFAESKLTRKQTIVWNVVPWCVEHAITETDVDVALPHLKVLLRLLPKLEVIVLMGKKNWRTESHLKLISSINIKKTFMPSPASFNSHKKRPEVLATFREVAAILNR